MGANEVIHGEDKSSDHSQHARDVEEKLAPKIRRSAVRAMVQDFNPLW